IDETRKKKEESLDVLLEAGFDVVGDKNSSSEDKAVFNEVLSTINSLPEDERDILIMRFVDGLDPKDIAEILDITANAASVRINRAMKSARENFNK
ncbi:MAG: sigma-70 family RNA polymerase sigma factor, partial [bacterium]|nr:sigma-70 family RNA polymerase sigma factor [bacterium]